MGKILINLMDDSSSEAKNLISDLTDGLTLDKLIEEEIASAGWTNRNLVIKSVRSYDADFKRFADITKPLDALTPAHMQEFDVHLNKAEPVISTIIVDIWINGKLHEQQNFKLASDATIQNLLDAAMTQFCKDSTEPTVNSVKYFNADFKKFIDVNKLYENEPILFEHNYIISITHNETISNSNPPPKNGIQQIDTNVSHENRSTTEKPTELVKNPPVPEVTRAQFGEAIERQALSQKAEPEQFHDARSEDFYRDNSLRTYAMSGSNREINILILGETGVGKSTWINGFANYLMYQTLKEAEKGEQVYLVPSQFTITDSNYKMKPIRVGESENESFEAGESSTQEPKSHVFNVGKKTICLIDTPGIGDSRGAEQDKKNFSSILRYIARFPEIHGVCILLKPNNSRLTIVFKYCINELLTHLHVSAAANIAFCFTNARGTFYRPGDTLPALEKFLKDLKSKKNVEIVTSKETIYCMDNESFRFLCCLHAGEQFTKEEHNNFEQSWTQSVKETERLMIHFEGVTPHIVGQTITLNDARELILTLAKPLADITQNIQDNIAAINRERKTIEELDVRSINLKKKLMIPQIGLIVKELKYPRTVCTGIKCVDTQTLPNSNTATTIYKTICHDRCYLDGVTPEKCPDPRLTKCAAMNPTNSNCKKCGCSWMLHMHVMFEQEKVEEMVEDPVTKQAIQKNLSSKQKQELFIKRLDDHVEKYRKEQKTIDEICAKFGAFLREHSILPYNDAIEDYLKFDIGEAKRQGDRTGSSEMLQKVKRLEEQLRQYQETKRVLDQNMQSGVAKKVEAAEIKKMQEELEQLELTGKQIKELFKATVCGQQINFNHAKTHSNGSQFGRGMTQSYISNQNNFSLGIHGYNDESQYRGTASKAKGGWWPWSSNR